MRNLYQQDSNIYLTIQRSAMKYNDKVVPAIALLFNAGTILYTFKEYYYNPQVKDFALFVNTNSLETSLCNNQDIIKAHKVHYDIIEKEGEFLVLYVIPFKTPENF